MLGGVLGSKGKQHYLDLHKESNELISHLAKREAFWQAELPSANRRAERDCPKLEGIIHNLEMVILRISSSDPKHALTPPTVPVEQSEELLMTYPFWEHKTLFTVNKTTKAKTKTESDKFDFKEHTTV